MLGAAVLSVIASLMVGTFAVSPLQGYYYSNENNIQMTKSQYEQLMKMGFDESEIDTMGKEKFVKLLSMKVIKTEKEESFIGYDTPVEVVGNIPSASDENYSNSILVKNVEYSDDELLSESGLNQNDMDSLSENFTEDVGEDNVEYSEDICQTAVSSYSYVTNDNEKQYTSSDATKSMTTYVSYVKVGSEYKIYVKQNINWTSVPTKRFSDILAINYTDNIRLGEANNYPDVEMHLKYTKSVYTKTGWKHKNPKYTTNTTTTDEDLKYLGDSQSAYNHKVGEYFAFKFDLPTDTSTNGSSQRYYLIKKVTYTNFKVSMESTFDTNFSNLTGTEMQSHYIHQTGSGKIDWGKLTFTTSAPYISYSTSFWVDDPSFEQALFNSIYLRFN
jgi:hypothetical protein